MLFYVQMKWNYQGRISQEELWALEEKEAEHGLEGIRLGFVQLFKVVSQHRIIAIVEADSLENLDRNSMGWLPMREFLEFEVVWALRDYKGFAEDVRNRFPASGKAAQKAVAASASNRGTRDVAEDWFESLQRGEFEHALSLVDDNVVWENISPTPGVTDMAPWLGVYHGLEAVKTSLDVWTKHCEMLSYTPYKIVVDGEDAIGLIHEHAKYRANNNEYNLYASTHLKIRDGKIVNWRVYWDPSPLVAAYKGLVGH